MMREAGVYLKDNKLSLTDGRIGAWNAGIIGYYQGGQVVNLDGLVNNNIYSYAVNNDLPSYLTDQNIIYIVDFQRMFAEEARRKRGGYNDAAFFAKFGSYQNL